MADEGNGANQPGGGEISAVTKDFKMPAFSKQSVEMWFRQLDTKFLIQNITSETTKYRYAIAALDPDIMTEVSDIIFSCDTSQSPYTDLKTHLIKIFADSTEKKLQKVLNGLDLGDKKPSELLREMKRLAGPNIPENILKSLFFKQLPTNVREILATSTKNLSKIAEKADKILEQSNQQSTISAVTQDSSNLEQAIKLLTAKIDALTTQHTSRRYRSPSPWPRRYRPRSRSRDREPDDQCWYHHRYGTRAQRCRQPCSFKRADKEN